MDKLLDKFSLQTFLRQFFCGVVFFVPIWLFGKESLGELSNIQNWEAGTFGLFIALASIIGTIIYHLEKNLWSYPMQWLHRKYFNCPKFCKIVWNIFYLCSVVIPIYGWWQLLTHEKCDFFKWPILVCTICFIIGFIACLIFLLFVENFRNVVESTELGWTIEDGVLNNEKEPYCKNLKLAKSIAKRVAIWSDFVHCVQSCCFSWLFGALFIASTAYCFSGFYYCSVYASFFVLFLEFLIDRHRYLHVYEMTKFFNEIK